MKLIVIIYTVQCTQVFYNFVIFQVIEYIQGLDWKKPAFCLFLLITMAFAYRAIVFMQKVNNLIFLILNTHKSISI